ncbi:uncharacterized protein LOC116805827 [Drosophila grimshawi]|uniref:uncharacterized protein LOC116805827 n=1 Tax=Drosophila grimshawi TaxID=7222 RepID=UPI000C870189|nr:uncharacterized protein LOC116805827 [Drosophila grimshawi]
MISSLKLSHPLCHSTPIKKEPAARKDPLFFSKYGWYRVLVYSSTSNPYACYWKLKDYLNDNALLHVCGHYYFHVGGEKDVASDAGASFTFYVKTFTQAVGLQQLRLPKAMKMHLRVNNGLPQVEINDWFLLNLHSELMKLYDVKNKLLDLSSFHLGRQLPLDCCILAQDNCLSAAIGVMEQRMPDLRSLLLDKNFLTSLAAFEGVENRLRQLTRISLVDNELKDLDTLRVFRQLKLRKLHLNRNPVKIKGKKLHQLLFILPHLKFFNNKPVHQLINNIQEVQKTPRGDTNFYSQKFDNITNEVTLAVSVILKDHKVLSKQSPLLSTYMRTTLLDPLVSHLKSIISYERNLLLSNLPPNPYQDGLLLRALNSDANEVLSKHGADRPIRRSLISNI